MVDPQETPPLSPDLSPYVEAMADFTDPVKTIINQLSADTPASEIGGFLGSGDDKHSFLLDTPTGLVVAKVLHTDQAYTQNNTPFPERTKDNAAPLIAGKGVADLEQLIAADPEQGILVTSFLTGKPISEASPFELMKIGKTQLERLSSLLDVMRQRGLHHHNAGGILLDDKGVIRIADYEFVGSERNNRGSLDSLEEFLFFALADFKKLDELMALRMSGMSIPSEMFKTTGLRAMVRAAIIKRAQKIKD